MTAHSSAPQALLTLNVGSSSLKYGLYRLDEPLTCLKRGAFEHRDVAAVFEAIADLAEPYRLVAAAHRLVHGGVAYTQPVRIEADMRAELARLSPLAPLHLPYELEAIDAVEAQQPGLIHIACFDTAFHTTQPRLARLFGLPRRYADQGVLRYGFHGLSYAFIASHLPSLLPESRARGRVVVAHLGNGASVCGMRAQQSVATSMGFSALDGLVMGTRCGRLDPGALLYLLEHEGLSVPALGEMLSRQSGLLGVSGISHDVRTLEADGRPEAEEALALFAYRTAAEIGQLTMALGGLEALVFTGGIGEHSARMRRDITAYLAWLGCQLDATANQNHARQIDAQESTIPVRVVHTDEEYELAREASQLL